MPAKRKYNIKGTNDFLVLALIFFFLCLWAIKDAWYPSDKVLKKHPREIVAAFGVSGSVAEVLVSEGDSVGEKMVLAKLRSTQIQEEFDAAKAEYTEAKKKHAVMELALKNANKNGASDDGLANIEASVAEAKEAKDAIYAKVQELKLALDNSELKSPAKGKVSEILVKTHSMVKTMPAEKGGVVTIGKEGAVSVAGDDGEVSEFMAPEGMTCIIKNEGSVKEGAVMFSDVAIRLDPKDHFYLFNKSLAIFSFFAFWVFLAVHILAR